MNSQLLADLRAAYGELEHDDGVLVGVVAAKGRTFCAGHDIRVQSSPWPPSPQSSKSRKCAWPRCMAGSRVASSASRAPPAWRSPSGFCSPATTHHPLSPSTPAHNAAARPERRAEALQGAVSGGVQLGGLHRRRSRLPREAQGRVQHACEGAGRWRAW
ncbi:MAG: hypothetical protein IPI06_07745 [Gammaproteobacteria bacterium]|nr:hypothetical protein [Gammaproteobacteria bacterium]